MSKILRWQGLLAFFLVLALLAVTVLVFLDTWLKWGMEKGLAQLTGAEVNIERVEHRLSPFTIDVYQLQLTDAAKPSHNQLQAQRLSASVELMPLLRSKVVIEELTMAGVAFDKQRHTPGEVYRTPQGSEKNGSNLDSLLDKLSLPDTDTLMANAPLKTPKAIEAAQQAYAQHQQTLTTAYENLPDKARLQQYKTRIKALQDTDYKNPAALAKAKEDFDSIKADLKAEQQKLKDFKQQALQAKDDLGQHLAELKQAPQQDYQLMQGLISGDSAALEQITQQIFGPQARQWSEYLLAAIDKVSPLLKKQEAQEQQQRISGEWVDFALTQALPDLWIKQARISIQWQQQSIDSHWQNITTDHDLLGKATTFAIDAAQSPLWQNMALNGELWLGADGIKAQQQWQVIGAELNGLKLLEQSKLKALLQSALLNSSGQLAVNKDVISGSGKLAFSDMLMSAEGSNKLTGFIANSLNQLQQLDLSADIGGNIQSPSLSLSSDLDRQLGKSLTQQLVKASEDKLTAMRAKLTNDASASVAAGNTQLAQLTDWLASGNSAEGDIEDMLQAQFKGLLDKEKDKLKDKLLNKLFGQ